jgi:hypothetical protein
VYTVEAAKQFAPEVDAGYNAAAAAAAATAAATSANAAVDGAAEASASATLAENAVPAEFVHPLDAPFHPSLVGWCI